MGSTIDTVWQPNRGAVVITKGMSIEVVAFIGKTTIMINGKNAQMGAPAVIVDGRAYLPVRDAAKAFGFDVSWDEAAHTITLSQ
jgi:hypothetical protein